jgi:hypothetical protein
MLIEESNVRKGQHAPPTVSFPFYYKFMFQLKEKRKEKGWMVELRLPNCFCTLTGLI